MTKAAAISKTVDVRTTTLRFWEVDTLRGVAIVMMVVYHLMWDLWVFRVAPNIVLTSGFWKYFQRTTAALFLILVGVSLTISYHRALESRGADGLFRKFVRRGAVIFGLGMVITIVLELVGYFTGFDAYVHFGILHLIGFSIAAAYPFLQRKWLSLFMWAVFFVIGGYVQSVHVETNWLVWLGLTPVRYYPVDFFPIFPYFGVVLLGIFLGNTLYPEGYRAFLLPDWSSLLPVRLMEFLGRHSLLIYLVHQPILFAILLLLGVGSF